MRLLMSGMALLHAAAGAGAAEKRPEHGTCELLPIGRAWSGHAVRFALEVTDGRIFVAYFDAERQLTVASRPRNGGAWNYQRLDTRPGGDSHNSSPRSSNA
jgi:hypothetical protein